MRQHPVIFSLHHSIFFLFRQRKKQHVQRNLAKNERCSHFVGGGSRYAQNYTFKEDPQMQLTRGYLRAYNFHRHADEGDQHRYKHRTEKRKRDNRSCARDADANARVHYLRGHRRGQIISRNGKVQ